MTLSRPAGRHGPSPGAHALSAWDMSIGYSPAVSLRDQLGMNAVHVAWYRHDAGAPSRISTRTTSPGFQRDPPQGQADVLSVRIGEGGSIMP